MKRRMLFYITLLLVLSAGVVQAEEDFSTLYEIGRHAVFKPPLKTKKDLWKMMLKPKVREGIKSALYNDKTKCPGTKSCSELFDDIYKVFPGNYKEFETDKFRDVQYDKDSVLFRWMLFRHKGAGKIKIAKNIKWGGAAPLPAYEFNIQANDRTYTFAVPKGCGNLALLKVEECPDCPICPDNCRQKCENNYNGADCQKCKDLKCIQPPYKEIINLCKNCRQCSQECKLGGYCEDDNCKKCRNEGCFVKVEVEVPVNLCKECRSADCHECVTKGRNCTEKCKQCKDNDCFVIETIYKTVVKNPCKEKNCNQCSDECVRNPYRKGCPTEKCLECKKRDCIRIVPVEIEKPCPDNCRQKCATNHYGEDCQKCRRLNCIEPCPTEKCPDECLKECKEEPNGTECQKCNKLNCIQPAPSPFHFIADLGYYRQSDPADYLFGRVGIEYNLSDNASWLEGVSLLTMIGAAPKIGGSDGDSAFLLDVIAQYNWLQSSLRGFTGLGLGGWFTSGDVEDDSKDIDLDIIANIGVRVPNHPNISVFFEMRNAVDELDSISEYGRFGAGVRFQF